MTNLLAKYPLLVNYIDHGVKEPIKIRTAAFKDTISSTKSRLVSDR